MFVIWQTATIFRPCKCQTHELVLDEMITIIILQIKKVMFGFFCKTYQINVVTFLEHAKSFRAALQIWLIHFADNNLVTLMKMSLLDKEMLAQNASKKRVIWLALVWVLTLVTSQGPIAYLSGSKNQKVVEIMIGFCAFVFS